MKLGTEEIAKYPFLTEAGNYLREKGFTLEQFGNDADLKPIIDLALSRIQIAADGKIFNSDFSIKNLDIEVFSFLVAVILLKQSNMNTLIKRFSLAEARRAEKFLEKDLINSHKNEELAIKIIKDLFAMNVTKSGDYFVIPASDYLMHSVHFYEQEWKLVNRLVDGGKVFLSAHETVRLIRKELDSFIAKKIQSANIPTVPESFKKPIETLVALAKKIHSPNSGNNRTTSMHQACTRYTAQGRKFASLWQIHACHISSQQGPDNRGNCTVIQKCTRL